MGGNLQKDLCKGILWKSSLALCKGRICRKSASEFNSIGRIWERSFMESRALNNSSVKANPLTFYGGKTTGKVPSSRFLIGPLKWSAKKTNYWKWILEKMLIGLRWYEDVRSYSMVSLLQRSSRYFMERRPLVMSYMKRRPFEAKTFYDIKTFGNSFCRMKSLTKATSGGNAYGKFFHCYREKVYYEERRSFQISYSLADKMSQIQHNRTP